MENNKAKSTPFEVRFDFPLASSDLKISLKALVEVHHSRTYYRVHDFHRESYRLDGAHPSIFPDQEIIRINRGGEEIWVHRDSERESLLSMAIGKAIEDAGLYEP